MSWSARVLSHVWLLPAPWTRVHQALLSMEFSRQEYWDGLPFLSPGDRPKVKVKLLSHVQLFATPWTAAHQTPLSMGFSRQEYWSGMPLPSPGDRPKPRIRPKSLVSPHWQAHSFTTEPPGKPVCHNIYKYILYLYKYMPDSLTAPVSLIKIHNHLDTTVPFWSWLYVGLAINFLKCERLTVGRIVKMWSHRSKYFFFSCQSQQIKAMNQC